MPSASDHLWNKRDDMRVHERAPYNAEPLPAALAEHFITPLDVFYSRNHGPVPELDAAAWSLRVDGLVENPLDLDLETLRTSFTAHTVTATMQCAGARRTGLIAVRDIPGEEPWGVGAISTARWRGARLRDVLAAAGLQDGVEHISFDAPDLSDIPPHPQTFGGSIPVSKAISSEVLLAWEMNGEPLPQLHGGPVRVVVPGYIGARSVKWVNRIEARRSPSDNYFQSTAYRLLPPETDPDSAGPGDGISLGSVALNSDILEPADGTSVPAGSREVRGYAYAGDERRVERVDVSLDGGRTWQQAHLHDPAGAWTWSIWETTLDLPVGQHSITVRAWDSTGATQPEDPASLWNPKGYINNAWGHVEVTAYPR